MSYKKNRQLLVAHSKQVKMMSKMTGIEYQSVNEGLKVLYGIDGLGRDDLDTYKGWQKKGYQVEKSSEAYLFWASPVEVETDKSDEDIKDSSEYKFYPICYLFSKEQVKKVKNNNQ